MKIDKKEIGLNHKPFIIAEMSGNHNQSLDRALEIVKAAADSGVDALKLQTYTPDSLTLDLSEGDFLISEKAVYGKEDLCMIFIRKHILPGNGIDQLWIMQKN